MKLMMNALAFGLALSLSAPATAGPQCTVTYPRGFKVLKGTKKHPVSACANGDFGATWRVCEQRYHA